MVPILFSLCLSRGLLAITRCTPSVKSLLLNTYIHHYHHHHRHHYHNHPLLPPLPLPSPPPPLPSPPPPPALITAINHGVCLVRPGLIGTMCSSWWPPLRGSPCRGSPPRPAVLCFPARCSWLITSAPELPSAI